MSLKRVIEALVSLGLSKTEARIYVFLEKSGSHNYVDMSRALRLRARKLVSSLKNLQNKKIVQVSAQQAVEFSAVPFEEAIDLLIEVKKEQAQSLQERKMELLSSWQNLTKKNSENN